MSDAIPATETKLFSPLTIKDVTFKNRVVVSPMCQYSAKDGHPLQWHFDHHMRYAEGGVALGFVEATGVEPRGRITHGCTGIWSDDQIAPMSRICEIYERKGAVPGIQIAHAGRKAAGQRPWEGNNALGEADAARGDPPWQVVGPTTEAQHDAWHVPHALSTDEIAAVVEAWRQAAIRSRKAGFKVLEIHGAHGYLIHSFFSPLANRRNDAYGGGLEQRMRFALEVTEAVRKEWPEELPLFYRTSAVDGMEGGVEIEDTVELAKALMERGVDVLDCSGGGIRGSATLAARSRPVPGFQVPYAERVRRDTGMMTMAVGYITEARHAEAILEEGRADLIALGRELLNDPFWALHAAQELGADPDFAMWPDQYGWYLTRRAASMRLPEAE
jgi:2,4-dienoyl-CoA reductase-like NADH-dependent reductase (Old Yellow Enzyme family)